MAKILVTGHRGLLGSACVRHFQKQYKIYETLTYPSDLTNEAEFYVWMRQNRPDAIIHCAAKVGGVKANRDNPVMFLEQNLKMQGIVFKAAFDFEVDRLVFVATSCLFPKFAELPVKEESLLTGPFEPDVEAYAVAKLAGYELVKAYAEQCGKNWKTVAPCNLYGIGDNYGPSAHVIPALIRRVTELDGPLTVWGDGTAIREFLYADDCAAAIQYVLDGWNTPQIINIGSGQGTSIRTLVETILQVSGINREVVYDTTQPTGIQRKTFNTSKIQKLGWGPLHTLEQGLIKTWADFTSTQYPRCK